MRLEDGGDCREFEAGGDAAIGALSVGGDGMVIERWDDDALFGFQAVASSFEHDIDIPLQHQNDFELCMAMVFPQDGFFHSAFGIVEGQVLGLEGVGWHRGCPFGGF